MFDIEFRELTLADKGLFDNFFKKCNLGISEYSFTNLFSWIDSRNIKFAEFNNGLLIYATFEEEQYFLPPICSEDNDQIVREIFDLAVKKKLNPVIKRVGEQFAERMTSDLFRIDEDRDHFDYIYNKEDMMHLKGRKFSNKRAFVKKFTNLYDYEFVSYDKSMYAQAVKLSEDWLDKKGADDKDLHNEFLAIKRLLDNYDKLGVTGTVLRINNEVKAFAFGEMLNDDTFVIHFEKADTDYVGIYQAINQFFVKCCTPDECLYVNREQDLGNEGIRKAKMSYQPVKLLKKFNISEGVYKKDTL